MLEQRGGPQSHKVIQRVSPLRISLPSVEAALDHVFDLGMEGAPEEVCGLIVNEDTGVQVVPLVNRSPDPVHSYSIDNQTLRQLALKPKTWAHVAVYHTHPGGVVGPSVGDLEHQIQGVKYVVVTIPTGEVRWF